MILACSVCYGTDPQALGNAAQGMNDAILFLLGCVGLVFVGIVKVGWDIRRRVRENEDLARVISEKMRKLPGIRSSETLIAFKVYSKQDIEAAFSLGLD